MKISAYFNGEPGGPHDKACESIFEARGGSFIGAGTTLVIGERDVRYDVPDDKAEDCKAALKKAGFRLEPTRDAA